MLHSYVVCDDDGNVTDMLSFYELNSSILNNPDHNKINIAYASYCFAKDNETQRLKQLFKDVLILAKAGGFDVFNVTEVLQHKRILDELLFKPGDGRLNHYLYNWRLPVVQAEEIGLIML